MQFDPNQVTFAEGEVRVQRVLRHAKVDISKRIMTSHDEEAKRLQKALPVTAIPDGFEKWQLPFVFPRSQFFVSVGKPDAQVENTPTWKAKASVSLLPVRSSTKERNSKQEIGCISRKE